MALLGALYGRPALARWTFRTAVQQLDHWAISAAQQSIARSRRLDAGQGELELLEAVCYRRWGEMESWRRAMEAAQAKGVPERRIQREIALSFVRSGDPYDWIGNAERELLDSGVAPDDVATAFLDRHLAQGDFVAARRFLESWERRYPLRPHVDFLWGFYWLSLQNHELALPHFQKALRRLPEHELARKMIAELLEAQDRLPEALQQHEEAVRRSPSSAVARLGLARTLRKMDRPGAARALLEPLADEPQPLGVVIRELGQLELEGGNHQEAERLLIRDRAVEQLDQEQLLSSAIASHLAGNVATSMQIIDRYDQIAARSARAYDLQLKLARNPRDHAAASEMQQLQASGSTFPAEPTDRASRLYTQHCSHCHGESGNGRGRGARHLYPRPRNFQRGKFRLVSTANGVPTQRDLKEVIARGMPGTSMPAFETLGDEDVTLLAQKVEALYRAGMRMTLAKVLQADSDAVDESLLSKLVQQRTTPRETGEIPTFGVASESSIANGRRAYRQWGCQQCHGDDGRGATGLRMFDDLGRALRPRDLVSERLKGGDQLASIYSRVRWGMPGTTHPAAPQIPDAQLINLVYFVSSLSREPKMDSTNYQRRRRAQEFITSGSSTQPASDEQDLSIGDKRSRPRN